MFRDATFPTFLGFPTFSDFNVKFKKAHVALMSIFLHSCVNSELF